MNNEDILDERLSLYNKIEGPRVGDYLLRKDGSYTRFTYDWEVSLQIGGHESGQYYLGEGYLNYSGSLEPTVRKDKMLLTDETKLGKIWFFYHDIHEAHNSVEFYIEQRVFKEI